jgi:pilus assembly protein CpaE
MSSGEEKIRVLIVDDIPETRENLKKMCYFEPDIEVVGTAASGEEGIEQAKQYRPHIVLMDINMPGVDGIAASEAITREVPFAQVVMMSVQSEADYLRRSMLAGARDFLTKPFTMDELLSTLRRVYAMSLQARAAVPATQVVTPETVSTVPEHLGKLIAVYSPKGGVGCTTLAVNLATAMAQIDAEARLAVMDCSLQFGDVGVFLDIRDQRSIVELAENIDGIEEDMIESTMVQESRTRLSILQAPPKPEMADMITTEHVQTVLGHLQRVFDYTVVDMGSRLQDLELSVFDLVDRVVLVITPDLPSIKDVRHFFELVEALQYSSEKILLVLNKADPRAGISIRVIENHLKHKVFAEIPLDGRLVLQSVNQGIPYMVIPNVDKRSPLIEKTGEFAQQMMQAFEEKVEEEDKSDDRPLGRLFN